MTLTLRIVVLLALLAASPAPLFAGSITLRCNGDTDGAAPTSFPDHVDLSTTTSTVLYAPHVVNTADDTPALTSFQCSFIVPDDYDDTGSDPTVHFYGWVPPGQAAGIVGCTQPNDLVWDIYWRPFTGGTPTGNSEAQENTTNTAQLTCESCASPAYCFEDEEFYEFEGDITDDPTNWVPGNLVVVRVDRSLDDEDDYVGRFLVWLDAVEITYTSE